MLRVALFLDSSLSTFGGAERVYSAVVNYFKKKQINFAFVKVYKTEEKIPPRNQWVEPYKENQVWFLEWQNQKQLRNSPSESRVQPYINQKFLKELDIAIIVPFKFIIPIQSYLKQLGSNAKIVAWPQNSFSLYLISENYIKHIAKQILKPLIKPLLCKKLFIGAESTDLILSISSGISREIKKYVPNSNIVTVYNPVLQSNYESVTPIKKPNIPIFGYVGRIQDPVKNLRFMFKGLSLLNFKWRLKIVGAGPDEEMLKEYAKYLKVDDRIDWLGFSDQPFELFRQEGLTAILLTSRSEGLPTVLIESIAYGIPVISSNCETGPEDIVIEGVNGYLYKQNNLRDFVEKITKMARGELKLGSIDEMRNSVNKFKIDTVCDKIYDSLNKLVAKV